MLRGGQVSCEFVDELGQRALRVHVGDTAEILAGLVDLGDVHQRRRRARRDDRCAVGQVRQRGLHGVDRADEIGIDHIRPCLNLWFALHSGDTSLRHNDIELAELGETLLECGTHLRGLAYVGLGRDDAPALLLDETRGLFEILGRGHRVPDRRDVLAQVHRDDVRALLGQTHRMTAALPASGTGDERDLAFYTPPHCCFLSLAFSVGRFADGRIRCCVRR